MATTTPESDPQATAFESNEGHFLGYWLIIAIILGLYQTLYAWRVLQLPESLDTQSPIPSVMDAGISVVLACGFAWGVIAVLRASCHSGRIIRGVISGSLLFAGLRLALFAQADYDRSRLPLLLIAIGAIIISLLIWDMWQIIKRGRGF